jgi:hypothetical protein
MTFSKPIFFGIVFLLIVGPFWACRLVWVLRSRQAPGVYAFAGQGFAGDQIKEDYSEIRFWVGKDTFWVHGLGNLPVKPGEPIRVRYQPDDIYDARVDVFAGVWGDTLVYSGIPALMLLVLFVHPQVVPWGSRVRVITRKPFIQIWAE